MTGSASGPNGGVVGVLSDTHSLLRPEAVAILSGSALIIHAGDVGDPAVLTGLRQLAPVIAVRGNVDKGAWAWHLPETEVVEVEGASMLVLHDLQALDLDPLKAGFAAVISGHSHHPAIQRRNGVLYLNPGSAGPRRFDLPVTVARLRVRVGQVEAEIVQLPV